MLYNNIYDILKFVIQNTKMSATLVFFTFLISFVTFGLFETHVHRLGQLSNLTIEKDFVGQLLYTYNLIKN